jgi:pimeloyl-ACP methyl ester carboxylesterase
MLCQLMEQENLQMMAKVNALENSLKSRSDEVPVPHAAPATGVAPSWPSAWPASGPAAAAAAAAPAAPAAAAADSEARHVPNAGPAGDFSQQQQQQQQEEDVTRLYPSVHAACEDYRASAWNGIDMQHDRQSRAAGQKLRCGVLAAWGERGVVARLFEVEQLWRAAAGEGVVVRGVVMPGVGHFIPEEAPEATAQLLREFFK